MWDYRRVHSLETEAVSKSCHHIKHIFLFMLCLGYVGNIDNNSHLSTVFTLILPRHRDSAPGLQIAPYQVS